MCEGFLARPVFTEKPPFLDGITSLDIRNFPNVRNRTTFVNSLMNITIVLKFIFSMDAFREYNSHLQGITS